MWPIPPYRVSEKKWSDMLEQLGTQEQRRNSRKAKTITMMGMKHGMGNEKSPAS